MVFMPNIPTNHGITYGNYCNIIIMCSMRKKQAMIYLFVLCTY